MEYLSSTYGNIVYPYNPGFVFLQEYMTNKRYHIPFENILRISRSETGTIVHYIDASYRETLILVDSPFESVKAQIELCASRVGDLRVVEIKAD